MSAGVVVCGVCGGGGGRGGIGGSSLTTTLKQATVRGILALDKVVLVFSALKFWHVVNVVTTE